MKKSPIEFDKFTGQWHHTYGGKYSSGYRTAHECGQAYVKALIQKEPKYKPLFEGKRWSEIFKIVGINIEGVYDKKT